MARSVTADADGGFAFTNVPAGRGYQVARSSRKEGWVTKWSEPGPIVDLDRHRSRMQLDVDTAGDTTAPRGPLAEANG